MFIYKSNLNQFEAGARGPLTKTQLNQVKKSAPKTKGGTLRSLCSILLPTPAPACAPTLVAWQ
jgi:hypothetical protein